VIGAQVNVLDARDPANDGATVADEHGRFRLSANPGELDLIARADAYSIEVRRVRAPARGVVIVLAPGGVIRGRVVASESEEPVADVLVSAVQRGGAQAVPISVVSGPLGEFMLSHLAGGAYELSALAPRWRSEPLLVALAVGGETTGATLELWPAATLSGQILLAGEPCQTGSVSLEGAEGRRAFSAPQGRVRIEGLWPGDHHLEIECSGALALHEALQVATDPISRTWSLERGLAVEGSVESALGRPVSGVDVIVEPVGDPLGRPRAQCVSDEHGDFSCAGLLPGRYECSLAGGDGHPASDSIAVSLSDRTVRIRLVSDAAATIHVQLEQPEDSSVGVNVFARHASGGVTEATVAGGAFVLERLPLGDYELYASASEILQPGSPVAAARLDRDGQVLEVTLPRAATLEIAGRVLDECGQPLVDGWVHARAAGVLKHGHDPAQSPVLTDDEGRFLLSGLLPGTYHVRVESATHEGHVEQINAGAREVVIRAEAMASISGEVVTADGVPVSRFRLVHQRGDEWLDELPVRGARWQLPWLRPGNYRLEFHAAGATALEQLVLLPGEQRHLRVTVSAEHAAGDRRTTPEVERSGPPLR
jgi:protocatechuate 3,4-dioxygenase beta subunit